jgi:signal transduction histidine kinase
MRELPHGCAQSRSLAEVTAMETTEDDTRTRFQERPVTLRWVALLSFIVTGALLLGWDLVEHAYQSGASEAFAHRMHIARGISTGVLVSVGIAALLIRSRQRHDENLAALQQELIRKERLAAVGELAGGVAHEIRNPLAGIGGALTMLAREVPADDDTQEVMFEIQKQISRMERLVQELLAYARPIALQPEWTDVHAILKQAIASVALHSSNHKVEIATDFDPEVPEIYVDARDLEHAFENLILNAFQAIPEEGTIEVRSEVSGENVVISIRDDGLGMDAAIRDQIFEPFFTTKSRGTGLGLSLVRRAVENYGGEIRVHSTPGEGTTFVFSLPAKTRPAARAREGQPFSD